MNVKNVTRDKYKHSIHISW